MGGSCIIVCVASPIGNNLPVRVEVFGSLSRLLTQSSLLSQLSLITRELTSFFMIFFTLNYVCYDDMRLN